MKLFKLFFFLQLSLHSVSAFCTILINNDYIYPVIHVIGDSHVFALNRLKGCVVKWLKGVTMHRVGRDKLGILNFKQEEFLEGEVVICVFGEIDVRCHIGKQREENKREIGEIIETLANKYIETIILNRSFYDDLFCIVYSVTPPTAYKGGLPCYGTLEDRVVITKKLNQKLSELCLENDIAFLNVYEDYAMDDGSLNPSLSDQNVHISVLHIDPIRIKLEKILKERKLI